jgi:hypothetical protein
VYGEGGVQSCLLQQSIKMHASRQTTEPYQSIAGWAHRGRLSGRPGGVSAAVFFGGVFLFDSTILPIVLGDVQASWNVLASNCCAGSCAGSSAEVTA